MYSTLIGSRIINVNGISVFPLLVQLTLYIGSAVLSKNRHRTTTRSCHSLIQKCSINPLSGDSHQLISSSRRELILLRR
ncbi:hypothetical protein BDV25DRAFT_153065 [Aspergillus avenaceus]|uniref:Uncharacterized protein n=1 Tax=Aspergillus avenaceus TaxID=36643 RepID=A0A5N6TYN7_ASPAV|nr:hypothetical protein BDV25DRAFT_153065 [Aspergillus avenaceus]